MKRTLYTKRNKGGQTIMSQYCQQVGCPNKGKKFEPEELISVEFVTGGHGIRSIIKICSDCFNKKYKVDK